MDTLIVKVVGMTCGGCAASVEKALGKVPGVMAVKASHADAQATVSGEALESRLPELRAAVENAGFDWFD
ncbi:hypothetical protein GCM10011289_33420 [Paludibacterium paludis]|uniref:HMA domain-containing protein n=2 Tax=Paludibacterium paludis TaxID=1225769 RepID=A0A918UBV0_9NEIS|nr:hypothetical protein GCM10011289_33420 [Paludibacterium paludis]